MLSVPALINAIIDALTADTLAAAVMEPPVAGGPHTGAGGLALVPGHALGHVGHAAVYCHLKYSFVFYKSSWNRNHVFIICIFVLFLTIMQGGMSFVST